ncbi:MAG TPA: protease inhibitor I42 family protein, partial [Longimicrobium sp.]|nr:protease inhibitor I42 family protein [Longimicrobium sp.]
VLLAACRVEHDGPRGPTTELTLFHNASGSSHSLAPGDTLKVELPSNPSTGYEWVIERLDTAVIALRRATFTPNEAARAGNDGAGGTATWRFAARSPGSTRLLMRYQRPWERLPADSFALSLTVTPAER